MGAKDSKLSFISYDDAVKRVSESELRRIREAFKRCAGANGSVLSFEAFVQEVLCDGVPLEVAEWLYQACGGTKRGITFKDLLRGVVVLTKGNIEEKIKFLWTLYVNNQNDNGTYIYKREFARALHLENSSLPENESQRTLDILTSLFGSCERVTFDQFRSWLLIHKDATVLSKWLLFDRNSTPQDLDTPTFYQSLAGVTHLDERDIIELEKCFWCLRNSAPTGELDVQSMRGLLSPPLPRAAVEGTFLAFDENRDGHIDFKELCCGLSAACRGPTTERLKFCFKIFDLDRDGLLNKKELEDMVSILCTIANEAIKNQDSRSSTPSDGESEGDRGFDPELVLKNLKEKLVSVPADARKPMFQLGPTDAERTVTTTEGQDYGPGLRLEEFLIWSVESAGALVTPCRELLLELCHVVLGLRPECRHRERDIVLGWLRRETCRGLSVGQFWYLVSASWWRAWLQYCGSPGSCCRRDDIVPDDSFTTNSTESMGSLLWPAESASLGSAGGSAGSASSGVGSVRAAPHPGPVDNSPLLGGGGPAVRALTGEGGTLRRDVTLAQHRDFELVPDALWHALALWYGAADPLPRQVIRPLHADVELELYPLQMRIYRHVPGPQRATTLGLLGAGAAGAGVGAGALYAAPPDRQLAYTAAFSRLATIKQVTEFLCGALGLAREDVRLWALGTGALLLDDERPTLQALRLDERSKLLLEVRNPDLTWPEEIGALGAQSACGVTGAARWAERRETLTAPQLPGATGLHNLGNTCYMNAALQSVWNTGPLARYFNSGLHLYEVNSANPLGTGGSLALRFGELCKEVWSSSARSIAPVRLRWCVSRYARDLAGGGQHDAQELLAWLLDALHEDLNRASPPAAAPSPAPPNQPAGPRADRESAAEAWAAHTVRNDSIISELFYGQLKSKVRCSVCASESVRFDTFNMLSLPLPMESYVCAIVRVVLLDGSVPTKYGVRVNSEGTYMDLKEKLSELCGLSPDLMLLVALSGATIGRVLESDNKVSAAIARELVAYELPSDNGNDGSDQDEWSSDVEESDSGVTEGMLSDEDERIRPPADERDGRDARDARDGRDDSDDRDGRLAGSVSVARGRTSSSLCMPALFCFKRSRSELLMSASPTALYERHTLPRAMSAPTSRTHTHNAQLAHHAHVSNQTTYEEGDSYLIAVHRKQVSGEGYLVGGGGRAALFGSPLVVCTRPGTSGRRVYGRVWTQLARLLSARPAPRPHTRHNHATDCDDSLGYEFPFTLRLVGASGLWCALCPWPALCRGCVLPATDDVLIRDGACRPRRRTEPRDEGPDTDSPIARAKLQRQASSRLGNHTGSHQSSEGVVRRLDLSGLRRGGVRVMLAIDWDPTALHLRYQSTREKVFVEHGSVQACLSAGSQPVDLASCLRAFTSEERLEARYHCGPCSALQPATKKLQMWRLPPVLIIHLKRFQYVNNKWIKSHKVVDFPFEDFDPTPYLASVPQETILRHEELNQKRRSSNFIDIEDRISESDAETEEEIEITGDEAAKRRSKERRRRESVEVKGRRRLESTSLITTPVVDDNLMDYHQHRLLPERDVFDLKYRLYAVVSHSGQLSGGHYVSYIRHSSGSWLCYNDSSCRELGSAPTLDAAAAYLLFYERVGLRYDAYLPSPPDRPPPPPPADDPDLKNVCSIV
ncbi:ubiquitin carboxyl-terminal hydrolase 32 isoform X2 [Danaus plexippus]|uniref:ubiquitin carboxyl-terminal hydrolase 32 isoform X2 n=1 Tax=Danaus plexippus TaxID=13037 RepID=UPI002AB20F81|nr:ubiquitin carboxyl-terminal hydrolase 32 isoform X2 [Danaus plexippus]